MKQSPVEPWTAQAWAKELLNGYDKESIKAGITVLAHNGNGGSITLNGIANTITSTQRAPASHDTSKPEPYQKPSVQQKKFGSEVMRMASHCMGLPTKELREQKFKALAEWGMKKAQEMNMSPSAIKEWKTTVESFDQLYK